MNLQETHLLIRYAQALDPRTGRRDDEEMALAVTAWHNELPTAMTLADGRAAIHEIHRNGQVPTPGAIGRLWDIRHTPLHQQGITTSPRGGAEARQLPANTAPAIAAAPIPIGRDTTAHMDRHQVRRHPQPLHTECPWCGAGPRQHCTNGRGEPLTGHAPHPSRRDAAAGRDVSNVRRRAEQAPPPPPSDQPCPEPPEWTGPPPGAGRKDRP